MTRPTPIDDLRRPHPDQARIDREAARFLLVSAGLIESAARPDAGAETQALRDEVPYRGTARQPGE